MRRKHAEEDSAASELRKNTDNDALDSAFDTSDDSDT